jgi:tRNA modification GTPase
MQNDTIAAVSTAPGPAGISIVRISGPDALAIADRVFLGTGPAPSSRPGGTFFYGTVRSSDEPDTVADEVVLLVFRAPHSYTREDVVELQGHGGFAASARIMRAVLAAGARTAEAGEFTRRAFLNGRIDLAQAEAVADLIRAQSDRAASMALRQMQGIFSKQVRNARDSLVSAAAALDAGLDFPEEDMVDSDLERLATDALHAALRAVDTLQQSFREGRLLRDGARVVIAGAPNVGKSSVFNALVGYERSIVTAYPGTTRDTLEAHISVRGIPVTLVDTAGIRDTTCEIESHGIRRAVQETKTADVCVYIIEAQQDKDIEVSCLCYNHDVLLVVANKSDLGVSNAVIESSVKPLLCSTITGEGIDTIRDRIFEILVGESVMGSQVAISERHASLLNNCGVDIRSALDCLSHREGDSFLKGSWHVHEAIRTIGMITGESMDYSVMESIFARFCVGK